MSDEKYRPIIKKKKKNRGFYSKMTSYHRIITYIVKPQCKITRMCRIYLKIEFKSSLRVMMMYCVEHWAKKKEAYSFF